MVRWQCPRFPHRGLFLIQSIPPPPHPSNGQRPSICSASFFRGPSFPTARAYPPFFTVPSPADSAIHVATRCCRTNLSPPFFCSSLAGAGAYKNSCCSLWLFFFCRMSPVKNNNHSYPIIPPPNKRPPTVFTTPNLPRPPLPICPLPFSPFLHHFYLVEPRSIGGVTNLQ